MVRHFDNRLHPDVAAFLRNNTQRMHRTVTLDDLLGDHAMDMDKRFGRGEARRLEDALANKELTDSMPEPEQRSTAGRLYHMSVHVHRCRSRLILSIRLRPAS